MYVDQNLGQSSKVFRQNQMLRDSRVRLFLSDGHSFKTWPHHTGSGLSLLHWLPVRFRIDFKILMFVFKILNGLAPQYLAELIHVHKSARALRSSNELLLDVPISRLKSKGDWAFAVAAPKLWNSLPLYIRSAQTLEIFKSLLKTHLLSLAFEACWA